MNLVAACMLSLLAASAARAQFPFLDPEDCSSSFGDPSCTPTPTCTVHGNAPAIYDPGTVTVVPNCQGGQVLGPTPDADGTARYACLYEPPQASAANPLPLVVFIHPSLFPADSVQATGLPASLATADLTGDPARPGFILLAPQGRNTCHYYPTADQHGQGWDNWYRNLDPDDPAENVDVATIDHFIDAQVTGGKVDPTRLYLTGWSNGSAMAYLYALHRPAVAAVAVYSSPDPFRAFNDPCPQIPVAGAPIGIGQLQVSNPGVPTFHVHNDCDIAGLCPMGERLEASIRALPGEADHLLINTALLPVTACDPSCGTDPDGDFNPCSSPNGYTIGVANHVRWPAIYNSVILDFFRGHALAGGSGQVEPLTLSLARVKGRTAGAGGRVDARGEFATTPPFDASAPVTVRVDDGLALDRSHSWTPAQCVLKPGSGRITCSSADRLAKAQITPGGPAYRFKISLRGLPIDPPFAPPVTLTLTHGSAPTVRMGSIDTCVPGSSRLRCRRRR